MLTDTELEEAARLYCLLRGIILTNFDEATRRAYLRQARDELKHTDLLTTALDGAKAITKAKALLADKDEITN